MYTGQFKKGVRHGRGKSVSFHEVSGDKHTIIYKEVYEGMFENNRRHGRGVLHQTHRGTFTGRFLKGNLANEPGLFEDILGQITYIGDFNDFDLTGQGVMTIANKKYVGQFLKGQLHGHGYVLDMQKNIVMLPTSLFFEGKLIRILQEGEVVNIW
jgi:hypothetical protein